MEPPAVVLIAYHADRWIGPCLQSLVGSTAGDWQGVLVDNGGNNGLASLVRQVAPERVKLLASPGRLPFAEANNFALVHGGLGAEYVCFLNQDTVSEPGWLDRCVDLMNRQSHVGVVMPLITNYDGTAWDAAFQTCAGAAPELATRLAEGVTADFDDMPEFIAVPEVTAAAMVVRTEALIKAGPFDPIYGSYYEDYDLCRRIAAAGYEVGICPRGRIRHYGGSVTTDRRAYRRRARWIARNRVLYAARWKWKHRGLGFIRYATRDFPRNLARSALGRSSTPLSAFLLAHADLAAMGRRILSARADQHQWHLYLRQIGWLETCERARGDVTPSSTAVQ